MLDLILVPTIAVLVTRIEGRCSGPGESPAARMRSNWQIGRTDSAALPSKEVARLERLGACLGRHSVRIIGHADPRHTDDYNVALSQRRG